MVPNGDFLRFHTKCEVRDFGRWIYHPFILDFPHPYRFQGFSAFPSCTSKYVFGILPRYHIAFKSETLPVATSCYGSNLILKCSVCTDSLSNFAKCTTSMSTPWPPPPFSAPQMPSRSSHFPYKRARFCASNIIGPKVLPPFYRHSDLAACTHHSALGTRPYTFSTNPICVPDWTDRRTRSIRERGTKRLGRSLEGWEGERFYVTPTVSFNEKRLSKRKCYLQNVYNENWVTRGSKMKADAGVGFSRASGHASRSRRNEDLTIGKEEKREELFPSFPWRQGRLHPRFDKTFLE